MLSSNDIHDGDKDNENKDSSTNNNSNDMMISNEDRDIYVGGMYSGSKVTKLEETVTDHGNRVRTRKSITVASGIIYTLDLFEEKKPANDSDDPPPEKEEEDQSHKVPEEFENGKSFPITVFPTSDLPSSSSAEEAISNMTDNRGVGEWRYPKDAVQNDSHFLPQDVDLYYGNDEPLFPRAASSDDGGGGDDDDDSSMSSFGLWGLERNNEEDDNPRAWTRSTRNICFPPGTEPSGDVDILGRWVPSPENKHSDGGNKWPPTTATSAWVFTRKDAHDGDFDHLVQSQGIWKSKDMSFDDLNWQPQQVDLYNNEETNDTDFGNGVPHGCWGLRRGAQPEPTTGRFLPKDVWFYPPGEDAEPECHVKGQWSMPKSESTWPPPDIGIRDDGTITSSIGSFESVTIPACFQNGGKLQIKVFPKSCFPNKNNEGEEKPKVKKKVRFNFIGQWAYPPDYHEEINDHWMPQTVDLYLGDTLPPNVSGDEASLGSFGVWGTKRGRSGNSLDGASISSGSISLSLSLDWVPEESLVFPPGVEPDEDDNVDIHGKWTFPSEGNSSVKIEWPPPMATSAWVFPESNVPGVDNTESRGIWRFNNGDGGRSQWQAKKVELHREDEIEEETDSKVWGKWGIRRGAEPDDKWNWDPKDMWFYPPNEEPEEECQVQGSWSAEKKTWPPKSRKIGSRLRQVGKLQIPTIESNLASPRVSVSQSPSTRKSVGKLKIPAAFGEATSP